MSPAAFDRITPYTGAAGACEPLKHTAYELAQWSAFQGFSLDTPQVRDRVFDRFPHGVFDYIGAFWSEPAVNIVLSKQAAYFGVLPLEVQPTYGKAAPWLDLYRGAP